MSIPVICDRCRLTGIAGLGDFAHLGDLLDFTPVPREVERVNGWSPHKQRAFIAALAATGSRRRAAHALGMSAYGVVNLRKSDGADSFNAAYDRALVIAKAHGNMQIASGLADIGARNEALKPPSSKLRDRYPGPDPVDPAEEDMDDAGKVALIERLVAKFAAKVGQERACRLAGAVVEADFYLRQVTCLEVAFDLMVEGAGMDAWETIARVRRGGHGILEIADTLMSRLLDDARRLQWERMGEPVRPATTPERYLTDHGTHRTADRQCIGKASAPPPGVDPAEWAAMDPDEQKQVIGAQHAADAAAQVEWEARARREYDDRRDSDTSA